MLPLVREPEVPRAKAALSGSNGPPGQARPQRQATGSRAPGPVSSEPSLPSLRPLLYSTPVGPLGLEFEGERLNKPGKRVVD